MQTQTFNKKVLLRERKSHPAPHIRSGPGPGGSTLILAGGGGGGYPVFGGTTRCCPWVPLLKGHGTRDWSTPWKGPGTRDWGTRRKDQRLGYSPPPPSNTHL